MDATRLSDAAEHLSDLIDRVEAGESLDITRDGRAVARLVPVEKAVPILSRRPIDVDALRALAATLPFDPTDSVALLRNQSRY